MSFVYLVLCCCLKAKSLVGIEPYKRAFDLLNSSSEIKGGPLSGFMKKWSIDWVHEGGPRTRDPYFEWMDEGMNEWMNEWSLSIVDDVRSGCPVSQARDSCIKFSTKHSHLFDLSLRIKYLLWRHFDTRLRPTNIYPLPIQSFRKLTMHTCTLTSILCFMFLKEIKSGVRLHQYWRLGP